MKINEMLEVVGGGVGGGVVANMTGNLIGRMMPQVNNGFLRGVMKLAVGAGGGILISKMLKKNNLAAGFFAGAAYEGSRDMIRQVAPNFLSGLEQEETVEDYLLRSAGVAGYDEQIEDMRPSFEGLQGNKYLMLDGLSDEEVLSLEGLSDEEIQEFMSNRFRFSEE